MSNVYVKELPAFLENIKSYPFKAEFEKIPQQCTSTTNVGLKNLPKNRYEKNVLPYDDNLVRLHSGVSFGDDYINASYIRGYPNVKEKFIACQAPLVSTMGDFWQMVAWHRVPVIVMLTKVIKDKSDRYWPTVKAPTVLHGDFYVTLNLKEQLLDCVVRDLTLTSRYNQKLYHRVRHIMFLSWEDKGIPDLKKFLEFVELVRLESLKKYNPVIIHCSAGVGRTGTLLAVWNLLDQVKKEKKFNVPETVKELRLQRMKMVETEDQLKFIYKCILSSILKVEVNF